MPPCLVGTFEFRDPCLLINVGWFADVLFVVSVELTASSASLGADFSDCFYSFLELASQGPDGGLEGRRHCDNGD